MDMPVGRDAFPNQPASEAFVAEVLSAFQSNVLGPIMRHAQQHPEDVKTCLSQLREKMDALEVVLADFGADGARATADVVQANPVLQTAFDQARSGAGGAAGQQQADDIGRNARSRVRELKLLEALSKGDRAYTLSQLMAALALDGFTDTTEAAVVSQLHRLKKNDVINQPTNGLYEITDSGLVHLRKLRSSVGPLLD